MNSTSQNIKEGDLLIAQPYMQDANFKRSVLYLCQHSRDEGAVGFVLNKPIHMKINQLAPDFPEFDAEVYYGGPVATDAMFYIHDVGDILDDSLAVKNGVYWGGDFEKLKFLISSKLIKPKNIKFFIGYSGWTAGQLEAELKERSWLLGDMDVNYVFKSESISLWSRVLHNKGGVFTVLAQMPEHECQN